MIGDEDMRPSRMLLQPPGNAIPEVKHRHVSTTCLRVKMLPLFSSRGNPDSRRVKVAMSASGGS